MVLVVDAAATLTLLTSKVKKVHALLNGWMLRVAGPLNWWHSRAKYCKEAVQNNLIADDNDATSTCQCRASLRSTYDAEKFQFAVRELLQICKGSPSINHILGG